MEVTAKDTSRGVATNITITNDRDRLSQDDIERMVREAEEYSAADDAQKEKVEARNGLEHYAYSMRNSANDEKLKGKLSAEDKTTVEAAVSEVTAWLDANQLAEKEEFVAKRQELEAICNPIFMKVHQQAGGAGGGGGLTPTSSRRRKSSWPSDKSSRRSATRSS